MKLNDNYTRVFGRVPILGMIHMTGSEPIKRALDEIAIYEEEGVDGCIIENYYDQSDIPVEKTLQETQRLKPGIVIGVNVLPNEFHVSFPLADKYGAKFIQLDHVAGRYMSEGMDFKELRFEAYGRFKERYPDIIVLGGVWPKYYHPVPGSDLERDLKQGMERAETIVVTGEGTGMETPLEKIKRFRDIIGDHPLIVGSGLTPDNAYESLCIADGAIVGTSLKIDGRTENPVDRSRVRDLMQAVNEARGYSGGSVMLFDPLKHPRK
jgi:membrane complex biogenesis BtpA family protein